MNDLSNANLLLDILGRAAGSDDDVEALALLRASRYLFEAARQDFIRFGENLRSQVAPRPTFHRVQR